MKRHRIPMACCPYYMISNLASNSNVLVYLTGYQNDENVRVKVYNLKTRVQSENFVEGMIPTSIKFVSNETLVITGHLGCYIYKSHDSDLNRVHQLKNNILVQDPGSFFVGSARIICENQQDLIVIGCSDKIVYFDQKTSKENTLLTLPNKSFVSCLSGSESMLAVGTIEGRVIAYQCLSATESKFQGDLSISEKFNAILVLCIMKKTDKKKYLLAGDICGQLSVCLLSGPKITLLCRLTAHAKLITGITLIDSMDGYFATTAEDTYFSVWELTEKGIPRLINQQRINDHLLVGVTCQQSDIFLSAYDAQELIHLELKV